MISVGGVVTKRKGAAAKTVSVIVMEGGACRNKGVESVGSAFSTVVASLDEGKTTTVCKGNGSAASLVSRVSIGMVIAAAAGGGKVPAATSSTTGKKKGEVIATPLPKWSKTEVKEKVGAAASSNGIATPVSKGIATPVTKLKGTIAAIGSSSNTDKKKGGGGATPAVKRPGRDFNREVIATPQMKHLVTAAVLGPSSNTGKKKGGGSVTTAAAPKASSVDMNKGGGCHD